MTTSVDWISPTATVPTCLAQACEELALHVVPLSPQSLGARRDVRGGVVVLDPALDDESLDRVSLIDATFLVATSSANLVQGVRVLNRVGAVGILVDGDRAGVDVLARATHAVRDHARTATARRELDATVARLRSQLAAIETSNVSERASIDVATGLWDMVYLVERLEDEANRLGRYGTPFGLLSATLGSTTLAQDVAFSQVLIDFVRRVDVCTRRGLGDFVVVCPNTDVAGMRRFEERLAEAVDAAVSAGDVPALPLHLAVVGYESGLHRSDAVLSDLAAAITKSRSA